MYLFEFGIFCVCCACQMFVLISAYFFDWYDYSWLYSVSAVLACFNFCLSPTGFKAHLCHTLLNVMLFCWKQKTRKIVLN